MKAIVLIGPPGSGKGTQIQELEKDHKFVHISTGDIARDLASQSKKYRDVVESGVFIDDEVILDAVSKKVETIPDDVAIIFDGVPRNLRQAEKLNELLAHSGRTLDAVLYIELEEQKIIDRLSKRRVCADCGKNLPTGAEKCAICGGQPVIRYDDQPATIIKRVQTFLEQTLPLVNYYQNKGILAEIDGDQTVERVAKDIKEKLACVENR